MKKKRKKVRRKRTKRRQLHGGLLGVAAALGSSVAAKGLLATKPGQKVEQWAEKAGKDVGGWFEKTFGKKKKKRKARGNITRPGGRKLPTLNDIKY